jgi:hypothetical protein
MFNRNSNPKRKRKKLLCKTIMPVQNKMKEAHETLIYEKSLQRQNEKKKVMLMNKKRRD